MGHVEVPSYKCCHGFMHIFLQFLLHVGIRENKETLINSTWNFSYETLSVCRSTEKQLLPNKERWAKEIHADAVQSSHSWVTNMIFPGGEERNQTYWRMKSEEHVVCMQMQAGGGESRLTWRIAEQGRRAEEEKLVHPRPSLVHGTLRVSGQCEWETERGGNEGGRGGDGDISEVETGESLGPDCYGLGV